MTYRMEFFIKSNSRLSEPYHFKSVGLPNIYLLNGVTFRDDPDYGQLVTIQNLNGLLHAIGLCIVRKPTPMTGEEFRFLRKQMDLTQSQLAERLDVDEQTVANYEKNKTKAGPANTAMRHLFVLHVLPPTSSIKSVKLLMDRDSRASNKPCSKIVGLWQETTLMAA